jgi:phosphohistidine phosphatase
MLLRHAKSSWDGEHPDHDRPLKKRGKKAAPRMGSLAKEQGLVPQAIVSSSARRARDTATLFADAAGFPEAEIRVEPRLYLASPRTILALAQGLDDRTAKVMFVGHNPGFEETLEELTDQEGFPTGALAVLELPIERWSDLKGDIKATLVAMHRPKDLDE